MKPHHNIFFYYRGPTRNPSGDPQFDSQLENNTTKALVNLLELGDSSLRAAFLRLIDPILAAQADSLHLRLQTDPTILSDARRRFVVSIINHRLAEAPPATGAHKRGLPDALLYALPQLGIMIESKVAGGVGDDQLDRHARSAGWKDWERRDLTWAQVHVSVAAAKPVSEPALTLQRQFLEYLEMIGMTEFVGFKAYDFDYFVSPDDQYKPILKTKLQAFGGAVYAHLPDELRIIYDEGPDLGQFKAGSGRGGVLRLRKKQTGKNAFEHCNFTIEINESGLSFNAVIRDGKATDLRKPIGALSQFLINMPEMLLAYLRSLGMNYTFRVSSREGAGGKRLMPGNEMWHLKYVQTLDPVVDETVPVLSSLLMKIPFPGVHLRREFPRSAVLTKTGEELVADAVAAISALFPILYLVEHGKLPPHWEN